MSGELPEGWAHVSITRLLEGGVFSDGDWVESKDQDPTGDVRLIQLADVGDGEYRNRSARFMTTAKALELGCTYLAAGDLLVARMPDPLGRGCIFPGDNRPSVTVVDVCIMRPAVPGPTIARYMMHAVNSPQLRSTIAEFERGTTRKRISRSNLGALSLPTAPAEEQRRIVEKVEALLEQVNRAKARLDRVPVILKRFRQAVLAAACSGELTREWRESADSSEKPALRAPCDTEGWLDADLPASWGLQALGNIATVVTGSTPPTKRADLYGGQIPFVKPGDLGSWHALTRATDTVTELGAEAGRRLPAGTVLVACIGNLGKTAILGTDAICNQQINAILPTTNLLPRFVLYWAGTLSGWLDAHASETTIKIVNKGRFETAPLPLPPLDEQREIVRRVDALFALADAIERRVAAATARAEKLPQAILAKAFAGELVPTEAELARAEGRDYETAEAMLARVTAERAATPATTPRKRRATKKG